MIEPFLAISTFEEIADFEVNRARKFLRECGGPCANQG